MTEPNAAATAEAKIAEREGGGDPAPPRSGKKRGPYKKRGRPPGAVASKAPEPEPITEAEIQMFGFLGSTIWSIQARFTNMEGLTAEETYKLGEAIAPVARKYIPSLDEYAPETTLIIMVGGLIMAKRRKPKPVEAVEDPPLELGPQNGSEKTQ